jgi:hypothetical protein
MNFLKKFNFSKFFLIGFIILLSSCSSGFFKKVDSRKTPVNASDRARQAVQEGRGVSIGNIFKGGKTNYEFSTSNPMWRASLDTLDFLPLSNVDYSGGIIISDWYSSSNLDNESIKISLRFVSNEIRSDSLKVTVFTKLCTSDNNCRVITQNSKIEEELIKNIISKAAELEKQDKQKK